MRVPDRVEKATRADGEVDDSVRAWRGLRYNEKYAKKLEEKKAKLKEKEAAKAKAREEEQQRKAAVKVNPFKVGHNLLQCVRLRLTSQ